MRQYRVYLMAAAICAAVLGGVSIPVRTASVSPPAPGQSPLPDKKNEQQDTWDVTRLYPSRTAWKNDVDKIRASIPRVEAYRGKISSSAATLYELLAKNEDISRTLEKAYLYAHLQFDTNTANPEYQKMVDEVRQVSHKLGVASAYITPEIIAIQDKRLEGMFATDKRLLKYRRHLQEIRKEKKHVLSNSEERILALTGDVASIPAQTYQYFVDSDLTFPDILNSQGKKIQVTRANYTTLMEDENRQVRKQAFFAMGNTYNQFRNTFASLLQGEVKQNILYARARNYPSARYASLHSAEIPEKVYDDLIATVNKRIELLHKYTNLRKKVLGIKEVHKYDLYVPLVRGGNEQYSIETAKKMVREGLRPLGGQYQQTLGEGFSNRWIDVYSRKGKTAGAYQTSAYGYPPYVLLNYQDRLDGVLTLAHEMGHAMHSYYADKNQPYLDAGYDIFVAEVASTVNESLLLRQWIEQAKDKREKAALLNRYLDMFQGTLFVQTLFAEFEAKIHEKAEKGEALTADDLSRLYSELTRKYYGADMAMDPVVGIDWARIPHFYKNFYVYQYATGFSAATALADGLLKGGKNKQEQYLAFLKAGGSKPPLDVLAKAGVDLRDPGVVSRALDVFERSLVEFEKLASELDKEQQG